MSKQQKTAGDLAFCADAFYLYHVSQLAPGENGAVAILAARERARKQREADDIVVVGSPPDQLWT